MAKLAKSFKKPFLITAGVLAPFILLALFAVSVVFIHDNFLVSGHSSKPSFSKDNNWGGLKVSIDIGRWDTSKPKQKTSEACSPEDNLGYTLHQNNPYYEYTEPEWPSDFECAKNPHNGRYEYVYPAEKGWTYIEGRVYLKNRNWNKSQKIPTELIRLKYGDGKYQYADIEGFRFGQFLGPRKGTSGTYRINAPYEARDGKLVLTDGDLVAEIR